MASLDSSSNGLLVEQDRQIELQAKVNLHSQKVAARVQNTRPASTSRAYKGKQKEWMEFCAEQDFTDGQLVTEQKLIYFLDNYVLDRPIRQSRYRKPRTDAEGTPVVQKLGYASLKAYIAALVDLWRFQKSMNMNPHGNPRGHLVAGLLRSHQRSEVRRKRAEYFDRGANTMQDGYTQDDIRAIIRYCWVGWLDEGKKGRKPQAQESYLRTAVDFLFSHTMLLRGEDRRALEFPDLFTLPMDEGPTPCWPMIMMKLNGKTNQFGRLEYMAVMRHKDPLLCTISQAAFYLFYRWEIMAEPIPQFYQRQQWYDFHFFKGADVKNPLSYEIQLQWINQVFEAVGLLSKKKTHSGRSGGARHAELNGVDENSIRRAGHWNQDSMSNCYLSELPRPFLRTLAGFKPNDQGNYYLPRATIAPPETLIQALWPWVDEWLAWFQASSPSVRDNLSLPPLPLLVQQGVQQCDYSDLAAQGFLKLLDQFRTIIFQDSVLLRQEFPGHPLWNHPIFQRTDYQLFSQQLLQVIGMSSTPHEIQLRQIIPVIADRMSTIGNTLQQIMISNHQQMQDSFHTVQSQFNQLLSGQVSFTIQANGLDPAANAVVSTQAVSTVSVPALDSCEPPQPVSQDVVPRSGGPSTLPHPPPPYRLSRTVQTVREVWNEWYHGLDGNPSVQSLETAYGTGWRLENKERTMFSRRKVIIDEIKSRQANGTPLAMAIEEVELIRVKSRSSLAQLQKLLKKHSRQIDGGFQG